MNSIMNSQDIVSHIFNNPPPVNRLSAWTNPLIINAEDTTQTLSFEEIRYYTACFASGLRRAGLRQEDRVMVITPPATFSSVLLLGVIAAGGVFTPSYTKNGEYEATDHFQVAEPSFILYSPSARHLVAAIHSRTSFPLSKTFIFDDLVKDPKKEKAVIEGSRFWQELLDFEGGKTFNWRTTRLGDSTATLTYTSGTTGPKKLVELTHQSHLAEMERQILDYKKWQSQKPKARCCHESAAEMEKQPMVILAFLDIAHVSGARILRTLRQAALGYPVQFFVMPHGYSNVDGLFKILSSQRITHIHAPTGLLFTILDYSYRTTNQDWAQYDFSHLSSVAISGSPCAFTVISSSLKIFHQCGASKDIVIRNLWGLTEANGYLSAIEFTASSVEPAENSVGRFVTCMEGKIAPTDDAEDGLSDNAGEVWVRGPMNMKGYWRQEGLTRDRITADGWLKTGDIGTIDDQGNLIILGRKKEIFKMDGIQINPTELEAALLNHPSIHDAAVIGVKKAGPWGPKVPRAFIKTYDRALTHRDIEAFMKREVNVAKELRGGIFFVKELPKTPNGKRAKLELAKLDPKDLATSSESVVEICSN